MLNIPESIKTLFKTDGVRKNFRAHFSNGELADITNDNIVRESLHFTESICSQNTFRFGLAEASVLEFETVGVGNMYGMTIEASIEIDTTSLTAAQISAIQVGTWDGELVLAAASDIGYGFFRVPLGVFRVESCPRNHGAMAHRQVTAYTAKEAGVYSMSPIEAWRITNWWRTNASAYKEVDLLVYLKKFIHANLGYYNPDILTELGYTEELFFQFSTAAQSSMNSTVSLKDYDGVDYTLEYSVSYKEKSLDGSYATDLYGVNIGGNDFNSIIEKIRAWFSSYDLDPQYPLNQIPFPQKSVNDWMLYNLYRCLPRLNWPWSAEYNYFGNDIPCFYALCAYKREDIASGYISEFGPTIQFPYSLTMTLKKGSATLDTFSFTLGGEEPSITRWVSNAVSPLDNWEFHFPKSGEINRSSTPYYQFLGEIDYRELTNGYLELYGMFEKTDRLGGFEFLTLSPDSAASISPPEYSEMWWDEYDVSPIGTVTITYKAEDAEQTYNIQISSGASMYDMKDNTLLTNVEITDINDILDLLLGDFATNAENVGFTPAELNMQGWPWLEAGDALQITAEDGTVVNTYALRVEMSGIQYLTATITAEGGEIIGEA